MITSTPLPRRRLMLALAGGTAWLTGVAAACAPAATGGGAEPAPAPSRGPVTLQLMVQGAQPPNEWDSLVGPYKERAPQVTVNVDIAGGGDDFTTKGLSLAAAGTPPHVSWASTRFAFPFAPAGVVADVQQYVRRAKLDVRDIPRPVYEEPSYKGLLYQLTSDVGYAMVAYNVSATTAAGRPDLWSLWERRQWTWSRFVDEAQALQQAAGGAGAGAYGVVVSTWDGEFFTIVRSHGGDVLDKERRRLTLDQPAAIEALESWAALVQRLRVAPPLGTADQTFASGKVPMEFFAQARIGRYRASAAQIGYRWDVLVPPARTAPVPTMFSNGYQLWRSTQEADAWALIAFALTPESLLSRGKVTGRVPSRLSLLEDFAKTLDIPAQDPKSFVRLYPDLAKLGQGLPYTANFTTWREIVEKEVLQPILSGQRSVREAVQHATPLVNAELAKNES